MRGDTIKLKGKRDTLGILIVETDIEEDVLGINEELRKNIGVAFGDKVIVEAPGEMQYISQIALSTSSGNRETLARFFDNCYRPCTVGDIYYIMGVPYKVMGMSINGGHSLMGIVVNETKLHLEQGVVIDDDDYIQPKLCVSINPWSVRDRIGVVVSIPQLNIDPVMHIYQEDENIIYVMCFSTKKLKTIDNLMIEFSIAHVFD